MTGVIAAGSLVQCKRLGISNSIFCAVELAAPPPTGAPGGAALVPYIHPRSRSGPKLAKDDATTTPPYALGFTVGSTISEDGKFLAYVALRNAPGMVVQPCCRRFTPR